MQSLGGPAPQSPGKLFVYVFGLFICPLSTGLNINYG